MDTPLPELEVLHPFSSRRKPVAKIIHVHKETGDPSDVGIGRERPDELEKPGGQSCGMPVPGTRAAGSLGVLSPTDPGAQPAPHPWRAFPAGRPQAPPRDSPRPRDLAAGLTIQTLRSPSISVCGLTEEILFSRAWHCEKWVLGLEMKALPLQSKRQRARGSQGGTWAPGRGRGHWGPRM